MTIATIIALSSFAPKGWKVVPATLLGVVIATAAAAVFGLEINYIRLPDNLLSALHWPRVGNWGELLAGTSLVETIGPTVMAALAVAFVASTESLLTATAVDAMQLHAPRTKYDRELFAQAVGNIACGLIGALPITGVIVRSGANVQAGAGTRLSAMLHGLWLLVFVAAVPQVLRWVPISSLAGILVFTGMKLVDLQVIRELRRLDRFVVVIYLTTLVVIVVVDLLTGIIVGLGLVVTKLLKSVARMSVRMERSTAAHVVVHVEGAATFLGLPKLAATFDAIPPGTEVHLHFSNLTFIDHTCLDFLVKWEQQHESSGGKLLVDGRQLSQKSTSGA